MWLEKPVFGHMRFIDRAGPSGLCSNTERACSTYTHRHRCLRERALSLHVSVRAPFATRLLAWESLDFPGVRLGQRGKNKS